MGTCITSSGTGCDGERKEPGRRPSGPPIAYSPLTSLPRMPLACFTVAFRQNIGFWSDKRWGLSPRGSWASQPPCLLRTALAGLPRAPGPAAASARAPGAPYGRPGGVGVWEAWGTGWEWGDTARLQGGRWSGGWPHLLQVSQQLRGLPDMGGLGLTQAVYRTV